MKRSDVSQRLSLLIAGDPAGARAIAPVASRIGLRTISITDLNLALTAAEGSEGQQLAAVIMDSAALGAQALPAINRLRLRCPQLPILILSSSLDASDAVEAMRAGATDYLLKPFTSDRLAGALRMATKAASISDELQPLSEKLDWPVDFDKMVGSDPAFRSALAHAALAARTHGNVHFQGEPGTGRTMLIRAMHAASLRAKGPLRVLNVRAFSENGLASSLFGHEQAAFAGAFRRQTGALQECEGGTLVLHEANRLPLSVQHVLARSIIDARVWPAGAEYGIKLDVRILSTSNEPLDALVEAGKFDPTLSKALAPTRIVLPPLRHRKGDIPALARHFISRIREQAGRPQISLNDDALRILVAFDWPSNVRQLQSVLLRVIASCNGPAITANDLPALAQLAGLADGQEHQAGKTLKNRGVYIYTNDDNLRPLQEIEEDVIRLAIGHYRGQMSEVARRLGVSRSTLYRKLTALGIDSSNSPG